MTVPLIIFGGIWGLVAIGLIIVLARISAQNAPTPEPSEISSSAPLLSEKEYRPPISSKTVQPVVASQQILIPEKEWYPIVFRQMNRTLGSHG